MKRIVYVLICMPLFFGCGIYSKYERPSVAIDSTFVTGSSDTMSVATLRWRDMFTDSCLQVLIAEGLERNPDLNIARLRVEEAQARLYSSKMAFLPSLALSPQGAASSYDHSSVQSYSLGANASWKLDLFGKAWNNLKASEAAAIGSEDYRQVIQTGLVASIADGYYTLLMLDRQLEISQRTAESWNEVARVLEAKKAVGEATEAAVAQANASQLLVEASVANLKKQIFVAESSLNTLLGRGHCAVGRSSLLIQAFPDEIAFGVPLSLLDRRPDVRQAERALEAASYGTNAARSAFYPSITLSGSAGWTNSNGGIIANPGAMLLSAVGSLAQPIFNNGINKANFRIAKMRQEEAAISFQKTILQAGAEVNNALVQLQTAIERLELDRKRVESLRVAAQSSRMLMENSSGATYLEVLTAQQSLLQAELTEAEDFYGKIQSMINLYRYVGGGMN